MQGSDQFLQKKIKLQTIIIAVNKEIVKQTLYNQNILFDFHIGRKTSYSTLNITAVIMTAKKRRSL